MTSVDEQNVVKSFQPFYNEQILTKVTVISVYEYTFTVKTKLLCKWIFYDCL